MMHLHAAQNQSCEAKQLFVLPLVTVYVVMDDALWGGSERWVDGLW